MKKATALLASLLCTMIALHAQTAKFDYYKGTYDVWKRGLKVMNYMEKNKVANMLPYVSAASGIASVKLKAIEADFLTRYAALKDVSISNTVVPADGSSNKDMPDFYERTYYSTSNNKVTSYMQVRITLDAAGVKSITLLDKNALTKRDKMILDKLKQDAAK